MNGETAEILDTTETNELETYHEFLSLLADITRNSDLNEESRVILLRNIEALTVWNHDTNAELFIHFNEYMQTAEKQVREVCDETENKKLIELTEEFRSEMTRFIARKRS